MDGYFIGAGAVLTAGAPAGIAVASLHAQVDGTIAGRIRGAVVDFEGRTAAELTQVVVAVAGWNVGRFDAEVTAPLAARGACTLADVLMQLARATQSDEVHLFARWSPDAEATRALARAGVRVVCGPIEAISQAALVSGQRVARWPSLRAA